MNKVLEQATKSCWRAFSSSLHDEELGRGSRRGGFHFRSNKLLLSPTLSSIRWRRGNDCGFAALCSSMSVCG
jgi:hypothetical protein